MQINSSKRLCGKPDIAWAGMSEALLLPDVRMSLKDRVYEITEADILKPRPAALELLCACLTEEAVVDLSHFWTLS